jgi:T5orf172 domain
MLQIVYVLTNPAMPGLVKIGKTYADDVGVRLGQLYTTGVPLPFDLAFACKVAEHEHGPVPRAVTALSDSSQHPLDVSLR